MNRRNVAVKERVFTIELRSNQDIRGVSFDGDSKVFVEGSLGPLKVARFVEDLVLEIVGENGVLRVDITKNDLEAEPGAGTLPQGRGGSS
ncbi:MAG: hypothetical protein AB9819_01945 [Methanomassiliicoccales archaeon]